MSIAPADLATPTALQSNATLSVAEALNAAICDVVALFLKVKNFHWHVSGPHFRDYHLMLDDHANQLIDVTDEIAERVRKTGNVTIRSIGEIARKQAIKDNDAAFVAPEAMLAELREDNLLLVADFRRIKKAADAAGDNATSGAVDGWTDQAEARAWFLFEASRRS